MKHRAWHGKLVGLLALTTSLVWGMVSNLHGQGPERLKLAYSPASLIAFPLILSKDKRIFQEEGLEVQLISMRPELAVKALISGDLQYTVFAGSTINAAVHGLPVKVVMVINDRPTFSLMSRSSIQSVKELKGKILGVSSLTSGESFLSRRILKQAGIDADRELTLMVIGVTPERLAALRAGSVDATTLSFPVDLQAEQLGLRRLVFAGDVLEAISGGLGVSNRWLRERPDQIKKMAKAVIKGMAYAKANRQESISLLMSMLQLDRDSAHKAFEMGVKTWAERGIASDSAVLTTIQAAQALLKERREIPISQVVDFTLVRQAFEELKQR